MALTLKSRLRLSTAFARDEVAQAVEVLGAGRAAVEMRAHAGDPGVAGLAGEAQLDVAVELLEALLAGQLRSARAEHPAQERVAVVVARHASSSRPSPT